VVARRRSRSLRVALDPVKRRARLRILTGQAAQVSGAEPEGHVRMTLHDAIERLEVAVDVTDRAEQHYLWAGVTASAGTGTSRSFLSQMKSFLL
jgi:hypothetical protein